ncbi:glycosyltransferase, partial [Nonomuraea sp. SBT364]|uniref:glycosyltransferase n=1 Tax=Nonomuraea sp. SBT364 TaxID=1580530 RepID=UPI00066CA283
MRVLIVGVGTRGDVAPYAGLGVRLRAAGHEVAIAAHEPYARLVTDAGLEFRAIPGDPLAVLAGGVRPAGVRGFVEYGRQVEDGIVAAAEQGADVLLLNVPASAGWHVAEALGIASMGVHLQPVEPTGDFPPVLGPFTRSLGRWGNRVAARTAFVMPSPAHAGSAGRLRARLGLPPMSSREAYRRREAAGWPVFHGFSPLVLPRPGDWRAGLEVTGYWWPEREQGWRPPNGLEDFLEAGPPPVFVGLGSLAGTHGGRVAEPVVRALRQAGLRAVVQVGAADMAADMAADTKADAKAGIKAGIKAGSGADGVFGLGEVPHDWLFPRVAAVAHHAGAGPALLHNSEPPST